MKIMEEKQNKMHIYMISNIAILDFIGIKICIFKNIWKKTNQSFYCFLFTYYFIHNIFPPFPLVNVSPLWFLLHLFFNEVSYFVVKFIPYFLEFAFIYAHTKYHSHRFTWVFNGILFRIQKNWHLYRLLAFLAYTDSHVLASSPYSTREFRIHAWH